MMTTSSTPSSNAVWSASSNSRPDTCDRIMMLYALKITTEMETIHFPFVQYKTSDVVVHVSTCISSIG
jgi:hypothetical protein